MREDGSKGQRTAKLFAGDGVISGFSQEMVTLVDGVTRGGDGMLSMREANAKNKIKHIETDKDRATQLAEARIQRIRVQFGRADQAFEKMQQMKECINY